MLVKVECSVEFSKEIGFQASLCRGASSVVRQLFPLNNFFSRTTEPNLTKLGRKYHWGMGIQIC